MKILNQIREYKLLYRVLITIAALYALAIVIYFVYTQSIVTAISSSGLILLCSAVPIKPGDEKRARLTNEQKAQLSLSTIQEEILIGCTLGDLFIQKLKPSINPRLSFKQSIVHKDYLLSLYREFKDFFPAEPKVSNYFNKVTGKTYSFIRMDTYSLPCFNALYELFYVEGTKIVPLNIGELLTALALVYWICDDGSFCKRDRVIYLSTEGFTLKEVEVLAKTLNDKWDLNCTINKSGNGYRIRIPAKSVPILQALLKDILPPMMKYKIGL